MKNIRLINAVEYCGELVLEKDYPNRSEDFIDAMEVAIADLDDMPTVDPIHAAGGCYCHECRYYNGGYCCIRKNRWGTSLKVWRNGFCSDGEKTNRVEKE